MMTDDQQADPNRTGDDLAGVVGGSLADDVKNIWNSENPVEKTGTVGGLAALTGAGLYGAKKYLGNDNDNDTAPANGLRSGRSEWEPPQTPEQRLAKAESSLQNAQNELAQYQQKYADHPGQGEFAIDGVYEGYTEPELEGLVSNWQTKVDIAQAEVDRLTDLGMKSGDVVQDQLASMMRDGSTEPNSVPLREPVEAPDEPSTLSNQQLSQAQQDAQQDANNASGSDDVVDDG